MSMAPIGVGIDVGKFDCVVAIQGRTGGLNFPNDPPGIAAMTALLAGLGRRARIGLEATDGYEMPLWEALRGAGLWVRQMPPARVHAFARASGRLARTDRIDAATIAAFTLQMPQAGRVLPPANTIGIKALTTRRRQLVVMRKALLCQRARPRCPNSAS